MTRITAASIIYKTLGFKWLHEHFCPASAFVSEDSDEARSPQRFIHVTVSNKCKKKSYISIDTCEIDRLTNNYKWYLAL